MRQRNDHERRRQERGAKNAAARSVHSPMGSLTAFISRQRLRRNFPEAAVLRRRATSKVMQQFPVRASSVKELHATMQKHCRHMPTPGSAAD
jgi:hypothetical protein